MLIMTKIFQKTNKKNTTKLMTVLLALSLQLEVWPCLKKQTNNLICVFTIILSTSQHAKPFPERPSVELQAQLQYSNCTVEVQ